jgi:hypothetical protein
MATSDELTRGSGSDGDKVGPLARRVLAYEAMMRHLVSMPEAPEDWSPLAEFVATDDFERVGTFAEVQNWQQYTEMLTAWAGATSTFESTTLRMSELDNLVFFEIEERHFRNNETSVVNSMTVFEFDEQRRIRRLRVYLQQPPRP